jgi:hypothetical protein
MFDLKAAILRGADAYDAANKFDPKDRAKRLNASEADRCIRWQWYDKNVPEKAAPQSWGMARRGSHMEKYVVERLRLANLPLEYAGDEQESIVDHEYPISATPDGELYDESGAVCMVEIKSIDPRTQIKNLPRDHHVTQVQLAMDLRQRNGDEIVMGAWIVYVNASDYDDIHPFWVAFKPGMVKAYAGRAKRLLSATKDGQVPAEGVSRGDCKYCPYTSICRAAKTTNSRPVGKAADRKPLDALAQSVDRIMQLAPIVAEEKQLREQLKRDMTDAAMDHVAGDKGVADLQQRSGASRFDRKAAEAAGLDLSPFTKEGAPSVALVITPKE